MAKTFIGMKIKPKKETADKKEVAKKVNKKK